MRKFVQPNESFEERSRMVHKPIPKGYKEMKETKVVINNSVQTVTTFDYEEPISNLKKASEESLSYLKLGGIDLTKRAEMPHFFRADITSNNVKEQLEKTQEYLDYLQAEAAAQEAAAKEPKETGTGTSTTI